MSSTDKKRVWVSSIIGIIVILILFWLIPSQTLQAKGILLPSKETRQPISEKDVIFYSNPPETYQNLGSIRVVRHYPAEQPKVAEKQMLDFAKKLAAQAGANGVVVKLFAHSVPGTVPAPQAIYSLQGIAIFSNDNNHSLDNNSFSQEEFQ